MSNLEFALKYAKSGLKIFPLHYIKENGKCSCKKENCENPGKHTIYKLAPHSHCDASSDLSVVSAWWSAEPNANIGLSCAQNGIFVLDIDLHDEKKNGFESLDDYETTYQKESGDTDKIYSAVTQTTGGGGMHMFFRAPADLTTCPFGFGKNYPGIDFKFNGYVLLEPSNHKSGRFYELDKNDAGEEVAMNKLLNLDLPPMPKSILSFINKRKSDDYSPVRYRAPIRDIDADDVEQIREALSFIPFDGIDYDDKLKIGMGLQFALPGGQGKMLYFDWLQQNLGSRFKSKQSEKHWRSFKYRTGGRTIASVFEIAAEFGFENKGKPGTYIDEADYITLDLVKVSDENNVGDVILLDAIEDKNTQSQIFMLNYWNDNGLPEGSIYIDDSVINFPVNGLNKYQKTYLINKWKSEGINENPDFDFIGLPSAKINYPFFIDFDEDGLEELEINPEYKTQDDISAAINPQMTSGGYKLKDFSIPITGDERLNKKLMEIATRVNPVGQGWPTQDEYESAHALLGNIPPLCALYDWHVQRSEIYIHEFSMLFALVIMSTLLSGRFTHGGLTTNLFILLVAPTGIGKTVTMSLMSNIFDECGESDRIGPSDIISDKGFYNDLKTNRAKLFPIDEWGQLQKNIFGERANGSQQLIRRALLNSFTAFANTNNKTASRADDKSYKAMNLGPLCPSVFGVTTAVDMFSTLNMSFINDGFFNRFLIEYLNDDVSAKKTKTIEKNNEKCKRTFFEWFNRARIVFKTPCLDMPEWENARCDTFTVSELAVSAESSAMLTAIKEIESEYVRTDKIYGNVYRRMKELTIRMSIIFEISKRPDSKIINTDSVESAFKLVRDMLNKSYETAKSKIVQNPLDAIIRDVVSEMQRDRAVYTYAQIKEKTALRDVQTPRESKEAINEMLDLRLLRKFRPKERRRGRPKIIFAAASLSNLCKDILAAGDWEEC